MLGLRAIRVVYPGYVPRVESGKRYRRRIKTVNYEILTRVLQKPRYHGEWKQASHVRRRLRNVVLVVWRMYCVADHIGNVPSHGLQTHR